MSSSNSPCAACKFLRRKCTQECVFAPYFPPDQPHRFANVHKVFGASNIAKLLNELNASQREDAVNTLSYEADTRLKDPVYGCVGFISILQQRLKKVQKDILNFKKELAAYIGPTAFMPMTLQPTLYDPAVASSSGNNNVMQYNMMGIQAAATVGPLLGGGPPDQLMIKELQHQQQAHLIEAQQLAAMVVSNEQEPMRSSWDQQQEQHTQIMTFNAAGNGGGYETAAMVVATAGSAGSSEAGFNQIGPTSGVTSPSLAVGAATFDLSAAAYHQIQHQQLQQQQDEQLELGALMATSANNNDVTRKS